MTALDGWWHAAADLLLGATCPGCSAPRAGLCPSCRDRLAVRGVQPVHHGGLTVFSAGGYDAVARRILDAWKERQAWSLRRPLGLRLAVAAAEALLVAGEPGPWWLVPMPSNRQAVRRRSADVTALLAATAVRHLRRTGMDVELWRALTIRGGVRDQSGLGVADRRANVAGRFALRSAPRSGKVLLVDDIVTTGATITEAGRVFAEAGIPVRWAAVVADTPRLRPNPGS